MNPPQFVVLGLGINGLLTCFYLRKKYPTCKIIVISKGPYCKSFLDHQYGVPIYLYWSVATHELLKDLLDFRTRRLKIGLVSGNNVSSIKKFPEFVMDRMEYLKSYYYKCNLTNDGYDPKTYRGMSDFGHNNFMVCSFNYQQLVNKLYSRANVEVIYNTTDYCIDTYGRKIIIEEGDNKAFCIKYDKLFSTIPLYSLLVNHYTAGVQKFSKDSQLGIIQNLYSEVKKVYNDANKATKASCIVDTSDVGFPQYQGGGKTKDYDYIYVASHPHSITPIRRISFSEDGNYMFIEIVGSVTNSSFSSPTQCRGWITSLFNNEVSIDGKMVDFVHKDCKIVLPHIVDNIITEEILEAFKCFGIHLYGRYSRMNTRGLIHHTIEQLEKEL